MRLVGRLNRFLSPARRPGPRRRGERGMSLLEVTVTLLLLTVVMAMFYEMILGAIRTSMFTESRNDLAAFGQRAANSVQQEIMQAKLILEENALGTPYRTLFTTALPAGITPWTNSRMPIIDSNTTILSPDPGPNSITNRTGNSLIVVRQLEPVPISYDHDANVNTPNIDFLADRYQFQYYFLRANSNSTFGGFGYYLDVVRADSQTFADYFQLTGISVNRSQIVQGLVALSPSISMAWDAGKAVSAPAFYNLSSGGTITANNSPAFTVTVKSLIPEFAGGRISGKMDYSVGLNSSTPLDIRDVIPAYATENSNFPGGLEFLVVGNSGSRKVLTRLVLVSTYGGNYVSSESSVITSARGF